jgi:hypothetical protein
VEVVLRGMHAIGRLVALNIREKPSVRDHEKGLTSEQDHSFYATPFQASLHAIILFKIDCFCVLLSFV